MRILQIQTQAEAGGAQRISDMLGHGLRARGYDVTTAFLYRKTDVYDCDPTARFMLTEPPASKINYVRSIHRLIAHTRKFRPDAIISFQHYGNIAGVIASRLGGGIPLIANQNGMPDGVGIPRLPTRIDKLLGCAGVYIKNVVNSAVTEAAFAGYPNAYKKSMVRIDHGVTEFASTLSREEARKSFGLPEQVPLVVAAGRLSEQKNHAVLISAIEKLKTAHLVIAGDGPLRPHLERAAVQSGFRERVHFLGEVAPSRMGDVLASADVFAFPSVTETFGLAVVEAAMAGVPVVCSDLPVLREVLSTPDGEAALFAPSTDAVEFGHAIQRLLSQPEAVQQMAKAQSELGRRYSAERMVAEYHTLLQQLTPHANQS